MILPDAAVACVCELLPERYQVFNKRQSNGLSYIVIEGELFGHLWMSENSEICFWHRAMDRGYRARLDDPNCFIDIMKIMMTVVGTRS